MDDLAINCELAQRICVGFLRDEITKFGFSRGVLGMSGGIDSTLSAFLAAEALGPENVLGLFSIAITVVAIILTVISLKPTL